MSEIEKMYENAGVKKEIIPCPAKYYGYNCTRNNWDDTDCSCNIEGYPPFTAEKQIELIKWLLQNKRLCIRKAEYSNNFYMDTLFNRLDGVDNQDFEICLASLVNNLWQDLTDIERKQIKEILK